MDVDDPSKTYPVRRLARDARRSKVKIQTTSTTITYVGTQAPKQDDSGPQQLTSLQQKLFDRMTNRQGVSDVDATDIILNNGYNKAASYGHMREAGANHAEAKIVIGLDSPPVSLAYGQNRAAGLSHAGALSKALHD